MVKIENDCCDCAVPGYPCTGKNCPMTKVPHYYCDECGEEESVLYKHEELQLCADYILKKFLRVE